MDESVLGEWRHAIQRYVHRVTGDPDLAEDIAQEALLRFLREQGRELRSPRGWLFHVATNLVRDARRRDAREQRPVPPDVTTVPTPDIEMDRKQRIATVRAVLDRLNARDREALMLREAGFRYAEIADLLGIRTESVPTLMMRALQRFRRAYELEAGHEAST